MSIEVIRQLVGLPPLGYEILEYIAGVALSVYTVKAIIGMFNIVFRMTERRK